MASFEKTMRDLGIDDENVWGNLYIYSLAAVTSLDLAAEAAGRFDVEAARLIRMAQTMVRTRVDAILQTNFYGEKNSFKLSNRLAGFLDAFLPATGADKAEMITKEKRAAVAAEARMTASGVDSGYINLLTKLKSFAQIEEEIYDARPGELIQAAKGYEHIETQLRSCSASISAFIWEAIEILDRKLNPGSSLWICSKCGFLMRELPEEGCLFCKAQNSLVVEYPFEPRGCVREEEEKLGRA